MEWHPYSETYPLLQNGEYAELKESISKHGVRNPIVFRLVGGRKQYLDGRNRAQVCSDLDHQCPERCVELADDAVMDFIDDQNEKRRHLDKHWRQQKVAARRAEGQSTRHIAEALGVSQATVVRDVAETQVIHRESPEKNGSRQKPSVAPKTTGKDGKKYPASKMCDRCTRIGTPVKNCAMCREARAAKSKKTQKVKSGDEIKDNYGNVVPTRCRDAFCDPWIQETFDLLAVTSEKLLKARLADGMSKRKARYPFFNAKDFIDGSGFVTNYLDQLVQHLKDFRPDGVCPSCQGKGCADCKMSGLVPHSVYKDLTGAKR